MPRVKYLPRKRGLQLGIQEFPNFSVTGSVAGMKAKYYGKDALLVRCGSWIYITTKLIDPAKLR